MINLIQNAYVKTYGKKPTKEELENIVSFIHTLNDEMKENFSPGLYDKVKGLSVMLKYQGHV